MTANEQKFLRAILNDLILTIPLIDKEWKGFSPGFSISCSSKHPVGSKVETCALALYQFTQGEVEVSEVREPYSEEERRAAWEDFLGNSIIEASVGKPIQVSIPTPGKFTNALEAPSDGKDL